MTFTVYFPWNYSNVDVWIWYQRHHPHLEVLGSFQLPGGGWEVTTGMEIDD